MRIGFFDSGIGGLSVLHEAVKALPKEDYVYYADTANVPYGEKTKDEVRGHVFKGVEFMMGLNIKALVVACNTATSVAIEDLRKRYTIPVVGMEPAVKPAVESLENSGKRVLVFATELSLKEEKFLDLVKKVDHEHIVDYIPLPKLVRFAENFEFDTPDVIGHLKSVLDSVKLDNYGAIVLGCTHYPFFKSVLSPLVSGISIMDGNKGTINRLKCLLGNRLNGGAGKIDYFHSGVKVECQDVLDGYAALLKRLDGNS